MPILPTSGLVVKTVNYTVNIQSNYDVWSINISAPIATMMETPNTDLTEDILTALEARLQSFADDLNSIYTGESLPVDYLNLYRSFNAVKEDGDIIS